jgi:hypothetical protein
VSGIAGALAVPPQPLATPLSALVAGLAALLGAWLWRWSGILDRTRPGPAGLPEQASQAISFVAVGLGVGLLLLAFLRLVLEPAIPALGARMAAAGALPVWRRALIIYVAAVGEEILFRLLLLSLIAGLAARLLRRPEGEPTAADLRTANFLAALAFAAVHLPAWMGPATITGGLAASVVALNLIGGLVFGHLFVRRGITAAILCHAGADCAIQFIGPLTG